MYSNYKSPGETPLKITYSTTEPAKPPSRPLFLGTTNTTFTQQCINNAAIIYLSKKAVLISRFKPLPLVNLGPYDALQQPSTYDISGSLIGSTESRFDLNHDQTA
ncbi:uncharacterized protein BDZ99DRAFT_378959 [Mytilinidion resinicola]|uniref:Uncharacterized protein n=1 Tax=Mytilinidion resinicola TaxID=574789 RepID=A0A6A6Z2D5_9PEZI|nr:uncharacterized protein BDZ99DRAFT_378959 [Mytilinidion resinicola]KAF2815271.1 hypothetical protein BDZ99DRAFT_378959 [Mytilinidion resinicola]